MLLEALEGASAQQSADGPAQPGGRRGLIGSAYRAYMKQADSARYAAAFADFDPLLRAAASEPRPPDQIRFAQNTAQPGGPLDPQRTDVFQRGPDGKLHPIPGWRTTGPFDVGQWARNIDWGAVARDLSIAAAGIPGAAAIKAPMSALDKAALIGGFVGAGWETKHKQDEAIERPEKGRPTR